VLGASILLKSQSRAGTVREGDNPAQEDDTEEKKPEVPGLLSSITKGQKSKTMKKGGQKFQSFLSTPDDTSSIQTDYFQLGSESAGNGSRPPASDYSGPNTDILTMMDNQKSFAVNQADVIDEEDEFMEEELMRINL